MKNISIRRFRSAIIPIAAALVLIPILSAFTQPDEDDYYYKLNKGLELFGQVYREISQSYVDQIDPDEFITAGIQGMLKTLDPYTVYLRKREAADIELLTSGSYGGIGITVGMRDSTITIVDVVDGYSAQREGVRIGDKIASINGVNLLHVPLDSLREYTRGQPNTTLTMTVLREGTPTPMTFTLTRENIKVRSVSYAGMVDGNVGYIRLDRFSTNAGDEVRNALLEFQKSGYRGVILDLRDNPGGLLESAVDVASKFVPAGSTIVTTRGRDSSEERVYRSTEQPIADGIPLVVMVNGSSASAAEIVAGAVQDLDAGVILGTPSFGKGLVQSVRRLPHEATLKMTTARYYTPSGRCIQKIDYHTSSMASGIMPLTAMKALYHTSRGRKVGERGGILPDTVVFEPDTAGIVNELVNSSAFFGFASHYAGSVRELPVNFAVDSTLLRQFAEYALPRLATPGNDTGIVMKATQFYDAAQKAGVDAETLRKIQGIQGDLLAGETRSFWREQDAIRRELYSEIVGRFRGQRERIGNSLAGDRQVQTALGLLHSAPRVYSQLLTAR